MNQLSRRGFLALMGAVSLSMAGCGNVSNEDYNAKNHVTFKGAYAVENAENSTVELWVLSTVDADEDENLNGVYYENAAKGGAAGTCGPEIQFDDKNFYTDDYYLNKGQYDELFAGTGYGCWSGMDTLVAGSGDKYHMVMSFSSVAKSDIEKCEKAKVSNVSYDFKFDTSDIKTVASREEVISEAMNLQ